ncbi:MAG: hypothetical protein ACLRIS_19545 [Flavonifractor plautii]
MLPFQPMALRVLGVFVLTGFVIGAGGSGWPSASSAGITAAAKEASMAFDRSFGGGLRSADGRAAGSAWAAGRRAGGGPEQIDALKAEQAEARSGRRSWSSYDEEDQAPPSRSGSPT